MATNDYGNKQEPGIITDLDSATAVSTSGEAPSDMGIVGQANLGSGSGQGSADPNTVYQVTRATTAREWFGHEDNSLLTAAIIDALNEDAYPVYAVAASSTTTTDDISGVSSTTVALANAPIREAPASITVTLDGTSLTTNKVYDSVTNYSPASGECYYNPVDGEVELPSVPGDADSTNDTVDYDYFDYASGHDAMASGAGEVIDFFVTLNENGAVVDDGKATVGTMANDYKLSLFIGGADSFINPSAYTNPYDDSRTQVVGPTRFADGTSVLGAYAGVRARTGIETTPIGRRFQTDKELLQSLSLSDRGTLIDKNVVPLADEAGGARISDDPTTVTDSNTEEKNLRFGFNRLVMDYIIEVTKLNEKPFIGRLNNPAVRSTLGGLVRSELTALMNSGVVLSYSVNVAKENATTASLEVYVDLAEPLRFIENTVTVGQGPA